MSRDFLSNFDRSKQKAPSKPNESEPMSVIEEVEFADNEYIRNVCFVWPEGNAKFLPYSRMDSGEINNEYDTIKLRFGSEVVEIKGLSLKLLFTSFMEHKRKYVYCDDARYNELMDNIPAVNKIIISPI